MQIPLKLIILFLFFGLDYINIQAQSCDGDNLELATITRGINHANISIIASSTIESGGAIIFKAGHSITLTNGFHAKAGSEFTARIETCTSGPVAVEACTPPNTSIWNNPWLSCQIASSPNTSRGNSHWIRYDLGATYKLGKVQVWNVNKIGESNKGFKDVVIDYSTNGTTWTQLGVFQFPRGTEAAVYSGFEGADFSGINARYVLITSLSNWGDNSCAGISDIKFNIAPVLLQDIPVVLATRQAIGNEAFVNIGIDEMDESIVIYPNPARENTSITVESERNILATISLKSIIGNTLQSTEVEIVEGQNNWSLSLSNIPSGTYFIDIDTKKQDSHFESQKLVVVRE